MSDHSLRTEGPAPQPRGALLTNEQIRWLRRAVMVMTAFLLAGIALVIGRIIYLARLPATQAASGLPGAGLQPALLPEVRLALPAGADIKSVSATGSRLVVLHTAPGGGEIITILDLATGQTLSRVLVERGK